MKLYPNWRTILRKAWSIRFIFLAGLFSAIEVGLPYFGNQIPAGAFAALTAFFCGAAFIARLVAQRDV